MIRLLVAVMCLSSLVPSAALACSSAIVSGRATPDGRPLLWKHRETKDLENDLRFFDGEPYDLVGVVNTSDTSGTQVWMGSNSVGFSIMNTNALNLEPEEPYKGQMDQDGILMKEALEQCGTVGDFEEYLKRTNGHRGVKACFGVIDAKGGAAYFECSPDTFVKFDVNDPMIAPSGYLIRTNYGFTGMKGEGNGYVRYQTLEELFYWQNHSGAVSLDFLILEATRCLRNAILDVDLEATDPPLDETQTSYVIFDDYVVQSSSASALIVQGVRPGEDPFLTTLWTLPSYPLTSPAIPVWVATGSNLPEVAVSHDGTPTYLTKNALALKDRCFPLPGRDGRNYLDLAVVRNRKGTGVLQQIRPLDSRTLTTTQELLEKWRRSGFNRDEAILHYGWVDDTVRDFYDSSELLPVKP